MRDGGLLPVGTGDVRETAAAVGDLFWVGVVGLGWPGWFWVSLALVVDEGEEEGLLLLMLLGETRPLAEEDGDGVALLLE